MISVTDLTKVYSRAGRDIHALAGVSLAVPDDTVHGVIGPSGAGKSTLVRCLALLDRPTSGTVEINGTDLASVASSELRNARRRLGVVFQHANLFDSRTVADNVAYPLELAKVARAERRARALELLETVGLADAADAHPAQLSGGQRQRVGIARALATDPDVLLCDEPTSALDPRTTTEILSLIRSLKARLGLAVLVITHEMTVVKHICDSVSLLDDGRIVESGPIEQVVGTFGSRLSEALLGVPDGHAGVPGSRIVEVLDSTQPGTLGAIAAVEAELGVTLPIIAATIEELGQTTFHRLRLRVPPGIERATLISLLQKHGAGASASLTVESVEV